MKYSDTPMGKAYAKAKESSPPPPPAPLKKGSIESTLNRDAMDVAARRYERIQSRKIGAKFGLDFVYDKVKDKFFIQLFDQKTQERLNVLPWTSATDAERKIALGAAKLKNNQPLTEKELKEIQAVSQGFGDFAANAKIKGGLEA